MCKSYRGFGRFSLAVGAIFLAATLIFGFSGVKIAVAAFFILLGAVDLIFYGKYGDRSTTPKSAQVGSSRLCNPAKAGFATADWAQSQQRLGLLRKGLIQKRR